jgi:hypothetical protein
LKVEVNGMPFRIRVSKLANMFTLDDFRVMTFEKKCDIITFHGNYLMQRVLADCKVFLYYTDGFFIEVFYSPIGLKPYLDKISLEDLVS